MGCAAFRPISLKRGSQPSLPVPISAARTSSSIAATVSASTFGNRAAVSNPQHSGANRAQNPDHSAATASASTSAPRRTTWRTSTASACKLTNRARLRALCRWLGAVPQPAAPETPAPLYTNNVNGLQGWVDTHLLLATDLQNGYWIGDDGKPTQTAPLRDIYGTNFEVRDLDTVRVNPGNPDLLLVSANYMAGPLGAASNANQPVGGIFLYELRTKRRVVLTPPEQSAHHGEWSRDGVQIFYTARLSSGGSMTYRVFWDGSAAKRYVAATDLVVGQ